jgi:putative tricarboxylic transport membrane protein
MTFFKSAAYALLLTSAFATSIATSAYAASSEIDRPECVAPAKPGGGFDLTCRVAQAGLQPQLGKPLQVTFMPGGIGAVAMNLFNTTRSDDPNAIVAFSSGSLLNLAIGKFGQWTEKDVRFVGTAGADFGVVAVRADSPFKSLDDVMKAFQANPQGVVVGAGGSVGSQDWMKGALLFKAVNLDPRKMRYVAFDGGGDAIAGLLGGSIQVYLGDAGEMTAHMGDGTMRILAVMSENRLPEPFAEIPTAMEQGYDAEWTILRGFYMGKNVSDEAYNAWVAAFEAAYKDPVFLQTQKDKGLLPLNMAGDRLTQSITERVTKMRQIARDAGLIQ